MSKYSLNDLAEEINTSNREAGWWSDEEIISVRFDDRA